MLGRVTSATIVIVCFAFLALIGCSGKPGRLLPPDIPAEAGQEAVTKYDGNGNGAIDGDELAKVPALKAALSRVDKNGDGQVSADEINERIEAWRASRTALMRYVVTVQRDKRPLDGATVTLVPEGFLGSAVKTAKGTTRGSGSASIEISNNPDESGVQLGYYRIEVTKPDASGKEQLPARFNTETELGVEVSRDDPNADHLILNLTGN